jgi:hypothetical protein
MSKKEPAPEVKKIIRNKLGPIPDDYFENDPIYPPPISNEWLPKTEDHGSDEYKPGDEVGGY